ncbi:hypothetical protein IWQ57_001722 [Coemansia nantahalensis]|uniref:Uncharacterized protein n=1 Tax=Coemansia nantahalensis TaxID=2789366 RepID=A0ACC1K3H4_9FUNG|nr:hypothetical protein IWQ57_001722 [Coemansia nantahalensis]
MGKKRGGAKRTKRIDIGPPLVTVVSRAALEELVKQDCGVYVDDECHDVVYCHSHQRQALIYTTGLDDKALEERLYSRIEEIHRAEACELMALERRFNDVSNAPKPEEFEHYHRTKVPAEARLFGLYCLNRYNADTIVHKVAGGDSAGKTRDPVKMADLEQALLGGIVEPATEMFRAGVAQIVRESRRSRLKSEHARPQEPSS